MLKQTYSRRLTKVVSILALSALSAVASASLSKSDISARVQTAFKNKNVDITIKYIEDSPLNDFYQVVTNRGVFYVDHNAENILSGSLLKLNENLRNLTQERVQVEQSSQIEQLKGSFLTYRAPNEKHEILVFYDTTCGYCQKLHNEIAQYNALGITVHYVAYPRSGLIDPRSNQVSQSTQQLASIWCAPEGEKHAAFEMVARQQPVTSLPCEHDISEQYELGQSLGVRGTPAIFDMSARLVSKGYQPPQAMLQSIERTKS